MNSYVNPGRSPIFIQPTPYYGSEGGERTDGVVYLSPFDSSTGRIKVDITQKKAVLEYPAAVSGLPNPYSGTFHRASETGERLVRIPALDGGTWRALVLEGKDFIVLGDGFRTDQTWPYDNDAAELNQVESDVFWLEGVVPAGSEIRFRVGMKSRLSNAMPDNTTPPRFGRIAVSYAGDSKVWIIYVRQGEAPVNLFPERNYSKAFATYNLTVAEFTNENTYANLWKRIVPYGNTSPVGSQVLSVYTEYPTQAGAYFQHSNDINQRYAYHPGINTTADIRSPEWVSFNAYIPYSMNTIETCPPGYRRPSAGESSISNETMNSLWKTIPVADKANSVENSVNGYYADGFFDRRALKSQHAYGISTEKPYGNTMINGAVSIGKKDVAYIGRVFYNDVVGSPGYNTSIFFPAAGHRYVKGGLLFSGIGGYYWSQNASSELVTDPDTGPAYAGICMSFMKDPALNYNDATYPARFSYSQPFGMSIRCVKR
jgi:hypothetical protein